jgi:hypothetical protein
MRSATAHEYLTTGIAYAFHPHRDTWYSAPQQIGTDTRVQPRLTADIDLGPEIRVVTPVGGIMIFSGQQLHATVPNTTNVTRFSIDFRTVHRGDLENGLAAPRVDSRCTGTSMRDFLNGVDLSRLPVDLIARYDDDSAKEYADTLVYSAEQVRTSR